MTGRRTSGGSAEARRVVVLGGGVVGLCVARELATGDLDVVVLDADRAGASSPAALGVLRCPPPRNLSAWPRLCRESYERHRQLASELLGETGVDVGYRECGALRLFVPGEGSPFPGRELEAWRGVGVDARRVTRPEIERRVPGFGGRARLALSNPREAIVHPGRLHRALARSCERRGVRIVRGPPRRVLPIGSGGLRVEPAAGLETVGIDASGDLGAARCVVAAGAWSADALAGAAGDGLGVSPSRGQAIELAVEPPAAVVHFEAPGSDGFYLVPAGVRRAWVGSTVEDVGFRAEGDAAGRATLLRAARTVWPSLEEGAITRHWAGLRPRVSRRGGPHIGPHPDLEGLWLACGHYRSGILAAPETGWRLARALREER